MNLRELASQIVYETSKLALNEQLKNVAMKTGAMRATIREELSEQIRTQKGQLQIKMTLDKNKLSAKLHYIKYHWRTAPRTNKKYYKNPTTPGTEPIKPEEFLNNINTRVRNAVFGQLQEIET